MRKVIILAPGKCGTTFWASKIPGSVVMHDVFVGRNIVFSFARWLRFWLLVKIDNAIVLAPTRDDRSRRVSMFWNDFERNVYNFSILNKKLFRKVRYSSQSEFITQAYLATPYETYQGWVSRNKLPSQLLGSSAEAEHITYLGITFIRCDFNSVDQATEILKSLNVDVKDDHSINSKNEFWHSKFHKDLSLEAV